MAVAKTFPVELQELIAERGISQREVARRTKAYDPKGLSHVSVGHMLTGTLRPSTEAMKILAHALGVKPEYFAEYRLAIARESLDPRKVGFKAALDSLKRFEQ
jgi:transcriptional regulator with XRE-family HTH domain